MYAEATSTQVDAVMASQPIGNLLRHPGPLGARDGESEIVEHCQHQAGLLPATRLVS